MHFSQAQVNICSFLCAMTDMNTAVYDIQLDLFSEAQHRLKEGQAVLLFISPPALIHVCMVLCVDDALQIRIFYAKQMFFGSLFSLSLNWIKMN